MIPYQQNAIDYRLSPSIKFDAYGKVRRKKSIEFDLEVFLATAHDKQYDQLIEND